MTCALIGVALAGCASTGGTQGSGTSLGSGSETVGPSPTRSAAYCPNPEGGTCLGPLQPGTYTTTTFEPGITYTVPEGWDNEEDTPGNFLLIPPGGDLPGVDGATSDYLGIYSGVAAANPDCLNPVPVPGTQTPATILAYWAKIPSLSMTRAKKVSVGGLDGIVVDLTLRDGSRARCQDPDTKKHYEQVSIGVGPADFAHVVLTGLSLRMYLLSRSTETVLIEIHDLHGGGSLNRYSAIVAQINFSQ